MRGAEEEEGVEEMMMGRVKVVAVDFRPTWRNWCWVREEGVVALLLVMEPFSTPCRASSLPHHHLLKVRHFLVGEIEQFRSGLVLQPTCTSRGLLNN